MPGVWYFGPAGKVAVTRHLSGVAASLSSIHWGAPGSTGGSGGGGGVAFVGDRWQKVMGYEAEGAPGSAPYADTVVDTWAANFDVIVCQNKGYVGTSGMPTGPRFTATQINRSRTINTAIEWFIYINLGLLPKTATVDDTGATIPEAWYAHDAAGLRIGSTYGGVSTRWLMEPSNTGWRAYAARQAVAAFAFSPYDGVFIDVLGLPSGMNPIVPGGTVPYTGTTFMVQSRKTGGAAVTALTAGTKVIANGLKNGVPYFSFSHVLLEGEGAPMSGGMTETFSRNPNDAPGVLRSDAGLQSDLDMVRDINGPAHSDRALACVKDWSTAASVAALQFGFGMLMLVEPQGLRATNAILCSLGTNTDMDAYPWLSGTNYGSPTAPTYTAVNSTTYSRAFDYSTLVVNRSGTLTFTGSVAGQGPVPTQTVTLLPRRAVWLT